MRLTGSKSGVRLATAVGLAGLLASTVAGSASAIRPELRGHRTTQPSMLTSTVPGATITPLITVGEKVDNYTFDALPDGISIDNGSYGSGPLVNVYVNHETSTVPFPYNPGAPTQSNSQNDFSNARLSRLAINPTTMKIRTGEYVIRNSENYQRFCSNFLATAAHGFTRNTLFTNEEAVDWVNRTGKAWPAPIGADTARQAGVVVAFDPATGERRPIWGMGRFNHENAVAVPGYGKPVVLSGDDTFTNNPSQSQLYSYTAANSTNLWNDVGVLRAFVSDDPLYQRYEDFIPGSVAAPAGRFIPVPGPIAMGRNPDGTEMMAGDVPVAYGGPYPLPPNDGTWQRDPNGIGIDGPQWVLEYWSKTNGVFGFVRVEDIASDKRPGMANIVYVADSGRATTGAPGPGKSTNGRVWKLVLDPTDPKVVTSFSILIEGDDQPVKIITEVHQPDNLETTTNGLYITEDPSSAQHFPAADTDPNKTSARLWQHRFSDMATNVVASVDQSSDGGVWDIDGFANGNLGAWEASGVVDASALFGSGAFLIDVQAHSLWVAKAAGDDNVAPPGPDFTYKREGGQLLLIKIPGG
ncbi:MAG: DUF839 domain-containing protein [Chloroflexi bacterium]|nr:DUF839 domain-containing protein [Chloroflexota bacterium]